MDKNISVYWRRIGVTIEELAEEVRRIANAVVQNPLVSFRVKDPETLRKKMLLKEVESVFLIDDVYGIRVIVKSVGEAYTVLGRIGLAFPGYLDHDYFKNPKTSPSVNGEILRLLQFIAHKNGVPFEIQITTVAFNEVNETLHKGYHSRKYRL